MYHILTFSLARYFVDQNLKKHGLGRLVHRLKGLLDGTLRKAKQVLERPPRLSRHSSSLLSMQDVSDELLYILMFYTLYLLCVTVLLSYETVYINLASPLI